VEVHDARACARGCDSRVWPLKDSRSSEGVFHGAMDDVEVYVAVRKLLVGLGCDADVAKGREGHLDDDVWA